MSILQWALLILGVAVVIAIVVVSRRERAGGGDGWTPPTPPGGKPRSLPGADQMDIFGATGQFDEFGVGRPRKRSNPEMGAQPRAAGTSSDLFAEPAADAPPPAAAEPPVPAFIKSRQAPSVDAPRPAAPAPASTPPPAPTAVPPSEAADDDDFIVLFVAEREGTAIAGRKLHSALQAQRLQFGAKQIYHRLNNDMVQFSVASIIKPGELNPADAEQFSSPGLTVFMTLPGPLKPTACLEDMFSTCDRLAGALNAEVFDHRREVLSDETRQALRQRVADWARARKLG